MKRTPSFTLPVTPEDLVRHALAAYYRAVGDSTAPIGDPDPASWSDAEYFLDTLCDFFELRIRCEAAAAGFKVHAEPDRFQSWTEVPLTRDRHLRDVDPGQWKAFEEAAARPSMAHGCAASSSAVGPAPASDQAFT